MKNKTPDKILIDILKGSNPITKMFIFDSIYKNIDNILKDKQATLDAMKDSFIHGESWIDCAEQLKICLNEKSFILGAEWNDSLYSLK
jgi:hypothetical protein